MNILIQKDPHNLTERISIAIDSMTTSEDSLKERLEYAAKDLMPLQTHEFPEIVQDDLEKWWAEITKVDRGLNGSLHDTLDTMNDEEIKEKIEDLNSILIDTLKNI